MPLIETLKGKFEEIAGLGRPSSNDLRDAVRLRKPNAFWFDGDGSIPNNPALPFVFYRSPLRLTEDFDPAAMFEILFARNDWNNSWRDGIYNYAHYHSRTHEVLGVARGAATVRFGGARGRVLHLKAGDVAILPAGTGHQRLHKTADLLVVGAYPPRGKYDECRGSAIGYGRVQKVISRVARPRRDPVYGIDGPLMHLWRTAAPTALN